MKQKILFLLASNKLSGAENVVCTIIDNLKDRYDCVYCSPNGPISIVLEEKGINYIPLNKLNYSEISRVIKTYNPSIIHANDYNATYVASLFHKKCKIISHIHGNKDSMNVFSIKSFSFMLVAKMIDSIIWVSESSYESYYYKKKIENKSIVLYNVIDKTNIINKSKEYKVDDKFDLIFLGRLAYPKNPEKMIEICKLLKEKKNDINVAIVGDGDKRQIIEELINRKALENNVKLFGFVSNPYPILKNSKILIMTSEREGTPMVCLEAQLFEKPIVSTPVDGLKAVVTNDYNGYLSNDNNELANKILEYLAKDKYDCLSSNSKKWFEENNNMNEYIERLVEIYEGNR